MSPMLTSSRWPPRSVGLDAQGGPSNSRSVAFLASQILTISTSITRRIETTKHGSTEVEILARSIHTVHGLADTLSTWRVQHTGTMRATLLLRLQVAVRDMLELSTFVDDFLLLLEAMRKSEKQMNQMLISNV